MPYIVKSSLEIGSTIIPWSEHESQKLIKEKKEYLEKKEEKNEHTAGYARVIQEDITEKPEAEPEVVKTTKTFKNDRKNQKAGEK